MCFTLASRGQEFHLHENQVIKDLFGLRPSSPASCRLEGTDRSNSSLNSGFYWLANPWTLEKAAGSLAALCKYQLAQEPMSGAVFVFRNAAGTALKLLTYDGSGYWLCLRRFSRGRLKWRPRSSEADSALHPLEAQQLQVLLYNGLPENAGFDEAWRKIDSATFIQAASAAAP
jgi:hypothetical protein